MVGRVARGPDALAVVRWMFALEDMRLEGTLLATRGDRLALVRTKATFRDGVTGPVEVVCLTVHQVNEQGLVTHTLQFDDDDAQGAQAELDARYAQLVAARQQPQPNRAWRSLERAMRAFECRDWDALAACLHTDMISE